MKELKGFQKKYLKKLAHELSPVINVGSNGLTKPVVHAIKDILQKKELIKIKLVQPEDKKTIAEQIAKETSAFLCGIIGHIVIIYHPNKKQPLIHLPQK